MAKRSRRDFIRSAAVAGVPAAVPEPSAARKTAFRDTGFAPSGGPKRISENLYVFEDTCAVFIVRDGSDCVLVDFGSGKVLDHLSGLGISRVAWILHTHHHRDQCQGDHKAVARNIPITVPEHEHHLFVDAENFWRNRRVFHLYYMRNDFNTVTKNIPVARALTDYSTFRWRNTDFFVLPTPGHTLGSITLVADIDGKRVAFTGDLLHSPGKIQNLYDTQINYGGSEGIDFAIYSLAGLRERKPQMLCPSHGEPMDDPDGAIETTIKSLADYYKFQTGSDPVLSFRPFAVSPHLVAHHLTTSSFYAIISDSGKALFIDYGSASWPHFGKFLDATPVTGRIRFVEHNIAELKRTYGLKSVDVAMPSHMHDDHMNGFPHLIRHYGTKVWCYENMRPIFENPRGENLGCILAEPFKVSRTFRHGEKFKWEEFEFEITHSPGHTEYQMALFATIDGKRLAFTGDAFFGENMQKDGTLRHNIIFRNLVENDSHLRSVRNLIEHEPEMICPGHGKPFVVTRAVMETTEQKFRRQQQYFSEILPEGDGAVDFGLNPSWIRIYPYQVLVSPGETVTLEIRVRNYKASPMNLEVGLVAPPEWKLTPDSAKIQVPASSTATSAITVAIPKDWAAPASRFAIAADVIRDGTYIGQVTEAVVDLRGSVLY
jgi:glyoxylase-like metal-dependent hydrolase (beta-lactamase superfamily II)